MKTIAYIDGGNLYHGLLRGRQDSKWLDIVALVHAMLAHSKLDASHELAAVNLKITVEVNSASARQLKLAG